MTPSHIKLTAHHFGCLTENIESSIFIYRQMGFQNISEIFSISTQKVRVCFIETGSNVYLELVEFNPDNASLGKIFKSKNPYYHVGYLVDNISDAILHLKTSGFYLINQFSSEAFQGRMCAFMYSPEMHLIELIET